MNWIGESKRSGANQVKGQKGMNRSLILETFWGQSEGKTEKDQRQMAESKKGEAVVLQLKEKRGEHKAKREKRKNRKQDFRSLPSGGGREICGRKSPKIPHNSTGIKKGKKGE